MKVAVVTRYPPLSEGISDYGRHVARSLAKCPDIDRLSVVANETSHGPSPIDPEIDLRRVWRPNDPSTPLRVLRSIHRARPDAVWYNVGLTMFGDSPSALTGFLLPALTRRLGIRSIVTLHELPSRGLAELGFRDGPLRRVGLDLVLRLLRLADTVCVTIDSFRQRLVRDNGRGTAELVYLPLCGYDEPTLEPFEGPPTALILTSHAPHKNLQLLLEAFRIVRQSVPNARLLVAGIDHPRFPGYLAQVRTRFPNEPGVVWLGALPDPEVQSTFRQAWVVVAPYGIATGSSATVHQAVGQGRPVVVSDLAEFRSMAAEEELWLDYFPRNDSERLGAALRELLVDPQRRHAIARHNYRSAQRNNLASTTDAYSRLLRGLPKFQPSIAASSFRSGARLR